MKMKEKWRKRREGKRERECEDGGGRRRRQWLAIVGSRGVVAGSMW